jgi:hypothetical protein
MDEFNFWAIHTKDVRVVAHKYDAFKLFSPARGHPTISTMELSAPFGMHPFCVEKKFAAKLKALFAGSARDLSIPVELPSDDDSQALTRRVRVAHLPGEDVLYSE